MKKLRRLVGITAVAAVAMGTAIVAAQYAAAEPASDLVWKACPNAPDHLMCTTIDVPLDYSKPDGEKIKIGLAKQPATNPDKRIGSLLFDPGGPGGSGVSTLARKKIGTAKLQEHFDVIGFDPRGINTSTQIKCEQADMDAVFEFGQPTTQERFDQLGKANHKLAEGCRKLTGPLFDHADNLHTVEDIERVRQALGEGKLNFLGYSYGTLMGQQYAEKYPKNIRAMVLDGNMDHSLKSTYHFASTQHAPVERTFKQFAEWCDTTETCALYGQGTEKVYGDLREQARNGDLVDPETGDEIDFYQFSDYGFSSRTPANWAGLATSLKALRDGQGTAEVEAAAEPKAAANYVFQTMFCSDFGLRIKSFDEWKRITRKLAKEHPNVQWSNYLSNLNECIGNSIPYTNKRGPLDIDDAPPLVMLGNVNDFATAYEWSQTAAKQSGATLLTYEGYNHSVYGLRGSTCIEEPVDAYLIDLKQPAEGISCPALEKPGARSTDDLGALTDGPYSLR